MNKKLIGSIAVIAIAALTAFNVNVNSKESGLSEVSLANVEALASEISVYSCYAYCHQYLWHYCIIRNGSDVVVCNDKYPF